MKRVAIGLVSLLIVVSVLLLSCAKPAPTPSPTPTPKPTPTPAPVKPIELVYASGIAKTHASTGVVAEEWMSRIEKATEGRVKIRGVYDAALLGNTQLLEGVSKGIADAAFNVTGYTPGLTPIANLLGSIQDLNVGNKLAMKDAGDFNDKLIAEFPGLLDEYKKLNVTPLFWLPTAPYVAIMKTPVTKIEDLYGKKIRTFGTYMNAMFNAVGAVPMGIAFAECYTSLQTGVIDGAVTDPPAHITGKLYEPAKYLVIPGPTYGPVAALPPLLYYINNNSLAKLTPQDQATFLKVSKEMAAWGGAKAITELDDAFKTLQANGVTIQRLPQAEIDKWIAKSPDWYAQAEKDLVAKGADAAWAKKLMTRYQELVKSYLAK